MEQREFPFYLDLSLIVGIDAASLDDAEKKMMPIVKRIARLLEEGKTDILQLSVYSIYDKNARTGQYKVATQEE